MEWTWQTVLFPTASTAKPHLQVNPGVATRGMRDHSGLLGSWSYVFGPGFPGVLSSKELTSRNERARWADGCSLKTRKRCTADDIADPG